ncbi:MAG: trimeric autotransporter adhesin [Solirubrobacteraceae bacterium]|nr:trimeric autotransporter adhesin [Solirubrobacteraceae bacterium]
MPDWRGPGPDANFHPPPGRPEPFFLEEDPRPPRLRTRRRLAITVAAGVIAVLGGVVLAAAAESDGSLTWSQPFLLAPSTLAPGTATGYSLNAVSCASTSLCIAVGQTGHLMSTLDATAGGAAWRHLTPAAVANANFSAVSCASISLCVAVTDSGEVVTSSDPTNAAGNWAATQIDGNVALTGVSCPTVSLCVAVDVNGNAFTSANPTGGAAAWRSSPIDQVNAPLNGISCASMSLCVAVDAYGNVVSTTSPTGGQAAWHIDDVDGAHSFLGPLSCASTTLCVAIDDVGNAVSSTNPAGGVVSWRVANVAGPFTVTGLACASASLCEAVNDSGDVLQTQSPLANSPPWAATKIPSLGIEPAISCPSELVCVAVDRNGQGIVGTGAEASQRLTVAVEGTGHGAVLGPTLSCPETCTASYPRGTSVTLTATPAVGSTFAGWGGACSNAGPCTVTMSSAVSTTATFDLVPPPVALLTVSLGGLGGGSVAGGGIACPSTCRVGEPRGARVSLVPRPAKGSAFAGWSDASCPKNGPCDLTMTGDRSVGADFARTGAPPPIKLGAVIYRAVASRRRHLARFYFHLKGRDAVGQCALATTARAGRRTRPPPRSRYVSCRSPTLYQHLAAGRYVFSVRAVSRTGRSASLPVRQAVSV